MDKFILLFFLLLPTTSHSKLLQSKEYVSPPDPTVPIESRGEGISGHPDGTDLNEGSDLKLPAPARGLDAKGSTVSDTPSVQSPYSPRYTKPADEQHCPQASPDVAEWIYLKRIISSMVRHIRDLGSSSGQYNAALTIDESKMSILEAFVTSAEGKHVQEASEILVNAINYIEVKHPMSSTPRQWFIDNHGAITALLQIVLIVLITLSILVVTVKIWWRVGLYRFLFFVTVLLFCISVPWTWVHLYKQNLAGRIKRAGGSTGVPPPECDPDRFNWYQFLSSDSSKCSKYYEDQHIEPLWEVKPTQAIAITFVEFVWNPLTIMGGPLGTFIRDVMEPLPFWMKPVVAVLGLMFSWWCLVLMSGMRVWTWFFTVEPAVTSQHELTAINSTVSELREAIREATDGHRARDAQLQDIVGELREQVAGHHGMAQVLPVMTEMVPVLQNMCADYAHDRSVAAGYGTQVTNEAAGDAGIDSSQSKGDSSQSKGGLPSPFSISRPDHLVLTTSGPQAIIDFYTKLGLTLRIFGAGRQSICFNQFMIKIHIVGSELTPHAAHPTPGCLDLCLACDCSVDTTMAFLKKQKVETELGPVRRTGAVGSITSLYLRDPDGNLIELAHYNTTGDTTTSAPGIQTVMPTS